MGEIRIVPVKALDLRLKPHAWAWAEANRVATAAHFEKQRERWPDIWNGRVLLLHRFALEQGVFRGAYMETDFASFLHWRDADFPDASEAPEDAETLAARVRVHLATTPRPELADVVIVRGRDDLSSAMPDFVRAYLEAAFAQR